MAKIISAEFALQIEPDVQNTKEVPEEVALQLERIAKMIREGYTSGFSPTWDLIVYENK